LCRNNPKKRKNRLNPKNKTMPKQYISTPSMNEGNRSNRVSTTFTFSSGGGAAEQSVRTQRGHTLRAKPSHRQAEQLFRKPAVQFFRKRRVLPFHKQAGRLFHKRRERLFRKLPERLSHKQRERLFRTRRERTLRASPFRKAAVQLFHKRLVPLSRKQQEYKGRVPLSRTPVQGRTDHKRGHTDRMSEPLVLRDQKESRTDRRLPLHANRKKQPARQATLATSFFETY